MTTTKPITGTILCILNAGSVIVLSLGVNEGQVVPVYCDATPFRWILEGEHCEAQELIGRKIAYGDGAMTFLD